MGKLKELLSNNENKVTIFIVGVTVLVIGICLYILNANISDIKNFDAEATNPFGNTTLSSDRLNSRIDVTMVKADVVTYENIETHRYVFTDSEGNGIPLSNCNIDLGYIIGNLENEVDNIDKLIVAIGVVGDTLYIQVDTRYGNSDDYKVGIMTLRDNLNIDDWVKLSETLRNSAKVYCDYHLNYATEDGNHHYVYIYSDHSDIG